MQKESKKGTKFDILPYIILLILCIIFVITESNSYEYKLNKLIDVDNYSVIKKISNEVYLQYNNDTNVVSIVYVNHDNKGMNYIRKELPYVYNEETGDLEYVQIETKGRKDNTGGRQQ